MLKTAKLNFSGMCNLTKATAVPDSLYRNAVNVVFDKSREIQIPRPGKTRLHTGSCKWVKKYPWITLFVEDGNLKQLKDDGTISLLVPDVGMSRMCYTNVSGNIYFANETTTGKIVNGIPYYWGCPEPPRQPDAYAVENGGGMFAGTYRIAITWLNWEESGTGQSREVIMAEGQGIMLNNFPEPPPGVMGIAVYVSSVNGSDMYLYGEYPANTAIVGIHRLTAGGLIPSIPLETQFLFQPLPRGLIAQHYGRIYYAKENKLFWTEPHRFNLQASGNYKVLQSPVQTIISCPNVLYVGTDSTIGKLTNIDGEGGAIYEELQLCRAVPGTECYDPDGVTAYCMSDRGVLAFTPDDVKELTYPKVAIPFFQKGAMTVIEKDGSKYLMGAFQDATQNPLADKSYNQGELLRGSL